MPNSSGQPKGDSDEHSVAIACDIFSRFRCVLLRMFIRGTGYHKRRIAESTGNSCFKWLYKDCANTQIHDSYYEITTHNDDDRRNIMI